MGPRSWDRGEVDVEAANLLRVLASMGPRSWDRGEIRGNGFIGWPTPRFNGAAVLGPRRVSWVSPSNSPHSASMGPRSWDRGERGARWTCWTWKRRFNGAAVLGPRRVRRGSQRRHFPNRFNGAAVLGPRRAS